MTDSRSQAEKDFQRHITMFGNDGYPIRKVGRSWHWVEFWGVQGPNTVYKTRREGHAAIERYLDILCDKAAGRL